MNFRARASWLCLPALALLIGGCGGSSGVKKGLNTLIDGNATCDQRVKGGATGPGAAPHVSVNYLTFALDPAATPKPGSGRLKGAWVWPASAVLTAQRSVFVQIDPAQTGTVRLRFDPADAESNFNGLSKTTRFSACFATQLEPEGEKVTPMTRFNGAIVTRARATCLRARVISERSGDAAELALPLGRGCD